MTFRQFREALAWKVMTGEQRNRILWSQREAEWRQMEEKYRPAREREEEKQRKSAMEWAEALPDEAHALLKAQEEFRRARDIQARVGLDWSYLTSQEK